MPLSILNEFKEFILKGNMVDLAVGIVIGAAFNSVVKSFVDNIVMPPMGFLMGGVDFADKKITLADAIAKDQVHPIYQTVVEKDIPAVTINYGLFINACIALLIQGAAIFVVVKLINNLRRKQEADPVKQPTPADVELLREIRDLLKGGGESAVPAESPRDA